MPEERQDRPAFINELVESLRARLRDDIEESDRRFEGAVAARRKDAARQTALLERLEARAEEQRDEHAAMILALFRMLDRLPPPAAA